MKEWVDNWKALGPILEEERFERIRRADTARSLLALLFHRRTGRPKWGEPRVTDHADLTVFTGWGGEEAVIDALLSRFAARREDAKAFALHRRVLLLESGGVGIDLAMGAFPFEEQAVERAVEVELIPGCSLRLCSPEDLIVYRAFAARAQDWHDIEAALVRTGAANLDKQHIFQQLAPPIELKEEPGILQSLERLFDKHGASPTAALTPQRIGGSGVTSQDERSFPQR